MFSNDAEQIRERIRDYRRSGKVTQQDLAIYLNINRGSYQNREASGNFEWEQIEAIADFFDVSPYFIQYGVEEEEIKQLAKMLNHPGGLRQPMYTIFDDINSLKELPALYASFLNMDDDDQKRIIRHIKAQNY